MVYENFLHKFKRPCAPFTESTNMIPQCSATAMPPSIYSSHLVISEDSQMALSSS